VRILRGLATWRVTDLKAAAEFDTGDIWAHCEYATSRSLLRPWQMLSVSDGDYADRINRPRSATNPGYDTAAASIPSTSTPSREANPATAPSIAIL